MRTRILTAALGAALLLAVSVPAAGAAPLTYFGGPIMHANTTEVVDWGSSVGSTYTSGDPGFLQALAGQIGSPATVTGILAQYLDSSGLNYSAAGYDTQTQITPSVSGTSITDAQIQSELKSQINGGHLPAPSGAGLSNLYVVLFPAGTQICDGSSCSSTQFCAYHSSTALDSSTRVLYAVMPDETSVAGCQQNGNTAFQSHTVILSHEWAEATNDPLVGEAQSIAFPLAWYNQTGGEIGDLCNQQSATNGSYKVQKEWSNLDNGCVSTEGAHYGTPTAAFPAPSGTIFGQQTSFSGSSSTDPSGNHTSLTYNGQTHTLASGIASYTWSWGDGTTDSSGVSPTHTFAAAGNYNVTLTVRDNLGFTSAVTHQVAVGSPTGPVPTITTKAATNIGVSGATLNGTVNPNGTSLSYHFELGTSPNNLSPVGSDTSAGSGGSDQDVSAPLTSLVAHTQYFFQVVGKVGTTTYPGSVLSFTTSAASQPPPPPAPLVSASPATDVSAFAATLHGSVNPQGLATTYRFEYGTSTSYGSSTPAATAGSGSTPVAVSYAIPSLAPNTTYHFRVVASSSGGTVASSDQTFTTGAAPVTSAVNPPGSTPPPTGNPPLPAAVTPKLALSSLRKPASLGSVLAHGLKLRFRCDRVCTVSFTLTFQLPRGFQRAATAVILARGTAKLKSAGKGTVVLRFNRSARKSLEHKRTAKLLLTALASGGSGQGTQPTLIKFTLKR
ncbi:MAG: PKD domain-containing protein [Thermoleophilaceae bacterium]